ncbi:MAG: nitronate monooxygenase [Proteobacteria bacterium]|nr:nitronate monooxygenase [Pseudomonadota bacterium]
MAMTVRTSLCDLLGIEYPVVLAGMMAVAGPTLAAAVSNAGGLGVIGATSLEPETIRRWIRKTRSLTDKPFGVDIVYPGLDPRTPPSVTTADLRKQLPPEHVAMVEGLRKELDVPEVEDMEAWLPIPAVFERQLQAVIDEQAPVLALGLGAPAGMLDEPRRRGMKVIGLAGNVRQARYQVASGADVVVAQGYESGGHTSRVGTMALVPQVVDALEPVPVLTAGGIGDGRGLVAALALGAVGAWMGTAFMFAEEAFADFLELGQKEQGLVPLDEPAVAGWLEAAVAAGDDDTQVSGLISGKTARLARGPLLKMWNDSGRSTLPFPMQNVLVINLLEGLRRAGRQDLLPSSMGQIAGMFKSQRSAKTIVEDVVQGAEKILGS